MPDESAPISKATAEHYTWGAQCDGWHLLKSPDLSVIQERMPPGTAEVRHFHHRAQQLFYVLAGRAIMSMDSRSIVLTAGEALRISPGMPHQMRNDSADEVHFLSYRSRPPMGTVKMFSGML